MDAKVTVAIATLDRLEYLEEAVGSVRRQEGPAVELIVVDNASTDGTGAWLRSNEAAIDATVTVEPDLARSRSGRIAAARNAALARAHGEYVWFLDDDDRLCPGALARLTRALDRHPEAVLAVGARTRFGDGVAGGRIAHPLTPLVGALGRELLLGWTFVPSQVLLRTSLVRAIGGWNEHVPCAEDLDMWARLLARGPALLEPETVVEYRVHDRQTPTRSDRAVCRESVIAPHATALAGGDVRRGQRLRRAGRTFEQATASFDAGRYAHAARATAASIALSPRLVTSQVMRPLSTRLLVRSSLRCVPATRRWVERRAQRPPASNPRRGAGFLS